MRRLDPQSFGGEFEGSFTDANDQNCKGGDRVQYQFGNRYGQLGNVYQDGDANVLFEDTGKWEQVKFVRLCKADFLPMTQPDSDSRQALIERAGPADAIAALRAYYSDALQGGVSGTDFSTAAWAVDVQNMRRALDTFAASALRQADEEIERVKKELGAWEKAAAATDIFPYLQDALARMGTVGPRGIREMVAYGVRLEASLSAATLRNEKLREALSSIVDSKFRHTESYAARLGAAQRIAHAALQLSPDPATTQEDPSAYGETPLDAAYQAFASLASHAGLFEHPEVIRALDYLAYPEKRAQEPLLPWPRVELPPATPQETKA